MSRRGASKHLKKKTSKIDSAQYVLIKLHSVNALCTVLVALNQTITTENKTSILKCRELNQKRLYVQRAIKISSLTSIVKN